MTILRMAAAFTGIVGLSVATGGCLQKETTATWYLEPDASLTWQSIEKDVRSDSETIADRQNEEQTYMTGVRSLSHPVALGLGRLGGTGIQARILRAALPYTVVTEAGFSNLGELGTLFLAAERIPGTSVLTPNGTGFTWTLTIFALDGDSGTNDDDVSALMDFERLHVVVTHGRFTAAQGFTLSSDKRVASLITDDDDQEAPGKIQAWTISLSWTRE